MSTFRQLDSVLLPDGFSHGVLVEVVVGARVAFDRKAVIACTTTSGLELPADKLFQHTEYGATYYGRIYADLGVGHVRGIAVDIEGGGRASLNVEHIWQPGNEVSKHDALDRWVRFADLRRS